MNDDERRTLLSAAFEPCDEGYLYYRNRWARGVRVSAEEREEYISSDLPTAIQLGHQFSSRVPVAPPRRYNLWTFVDAMPYSFASGMGAAAIATAFKAEGTTSPPLSWLLWAAAIFEAAIALTIAWRGFIRERSTAKG